MQQVRTDGRWIDGPLLINQYGHTWTEAVALGMEPVAASHAGTYRAAMMRAGQFCKDGAIPTLAPRELSRDKAPCKEVVLTGDAIDVRKFAYIQSNPADAGRSSTQGRSSPGIRSSAATSAPIAARSRVPRASA